LGVSVGIQAAYPHDRYPTSLTVTATNAFRGSPDFFDVQATSGAAYSVEKLPFGAEAIFQFYGTAAENPKKT
jgi:hypothetical protein